MSDNEETGDDPIVAEATQLAQEIHQKAAAEGYDDPNKYLEEQQESPDVQHLVQRGQQIKSQFETNRALERAPELSDPDEQRAFVEDLRTRGYSDQEIRSIANDGRLVGDLYRAGRGASKPKGRPKFKSSTDKGVEQMRGEPQRRTSIEKESVDRLQELTRAGRTDAAVELMRRNR